MVKLERASLRGLRGRQVRRERSILRDREREKDRDRERGGGR